MLFQTIIIHSDKAKLQYKNNKINQLETLCEISNIGVDLLIPQAFKSAQVNLKNISMHSEIEVGLDQLTI